MKLTRDHSPYELEIKLEDLIDATSASDVLCAIASVCFGKSDHIRSNWQDEGSAKIWERIGKYVDAARAKVEKLEV